MADKKQNLGHAPKLGPGPEDLKEPIEKIPGNSRVWSIWASFRRLGVSEYLKAELGPFLLQSVTVER